MVPDPPKPRRMAAIGLVLLVLGVIMWLTGFDIPLGRRRSLFLYVFIGTIGCFAVALSRPKKWR
jgi:hypothetical protein